MPDLLIGCGSTRSKKICVVGNEEWNGLVTLDMNADHKPDVVHDLNVRPLPFESDTFDEVHAYDVMEHLSAQGDFAGFFAEWSEIWRILKPEGLFFGISPHWSSPWAWMDPGHRRAYGPECLTFLNQTQYTAQVGRTPMTDYRFCYEADFDVKHTAITDEKQFQYILQAVKPSRITRDNA